MFDDDVAEHMLNLIEERHAHAEYDWPGWVLGARSLQFPILLPPLFLVMQAWGIVAWSVPMLAGGACWRLWKWRHSRRCAHQLSEECGLSSKQITVCRSSLTCSGTKSELQQFHDFGGEFFEPYDYSYSVQRHWTEGAAIIVTFLVVLVARGHGLVVLLLGPCVGAGLALVVLRLLARHVRVMPGRIEVLRRLPVGTDGDEIQTTVSLRDTTIICRFAAQRLAIGSGFATGGVVFDLRRMSKPHDFARQVFRAAMATRDAPLADTPSR